MREEHSSEAVVVPLRPVPHFTISQRFFAEEHLLAMARQAFAAALEEAKPDAEYMRESAVEALEGKTPVVWMSHEGFAECVVRSIAKQLYERARAKGIDVDFQIATPGGGTSAWMSRLAHMESMQSE